MKTSESHPEIDGNILVVCTGNVCRSPYMERRLVQLLAGTRLTVRSRGTRALEGAPMDATISSLLTAAGASADEFVATQLRAEDVTTADLVVAATREHRASVVRMHPRANSRCFTLRDLANLAAGFEYPADDEGRGMPLSRLVPLVAARRGFVPTRISTDADIVDPYGRGTRVFLRMQKQVEEALPGVVGFLLGNPR